MTLHRKLVRLAHEKPSTRKVLVPLLRMAADYHFPALDAYLQRLTVEGVSETEVAAQKAVNEEVQKATRALDDIEHSLAGSVRREFSDTRAPMYWYLRRLIVPLAMIKEKAPKPRKFLRPRSE